MIELLSYPFMQRALAGGVLVGLLASYFGVFVVQRQLSFLGAGLAHAAFGGVALGLLLQTEPLWVAVPFTVLVSLGINWVRTHTRLAGDTAVGVFFAVAVALGLVFLSFRESATVDAFAYLFGSVLTVTRTDIIITAALTGIAALSVPRYWGRWAYASFDRDAAIADRLPVDRDDYVLFTLLAITVVVAVKVVGIVLMAAFLVIPAATARMQASTFAGSTILSVAIGTASALIGLLLSYEIDLPSGATIILVQATAFTLVAVAARRGA